VSRGLAEDVRRYIDRGLARYGRGELREAIEEWQEALVLDGRNSEARTLIDFVSQKLAVQDEVSHADQRITEPVIPTFDDFISKKRPGDTDEHSSFLTALDAGFEDPTRVGEPPPQRHPTLESPIPQLLAQITDPTWSGPAEREEAAPDIPLFEDTRRLGSEPHNMSGRVPFIAEQPTADSGTEFRARAAELVDRCRRQLEIGNLEGAVAAAESALREGERAPSPGIPEVIGPARSLFETAFEAFLGPTQGIPVHSMSAAALATQGLDHRAGFLLSRIDGAITIEGLLDIASMPRFEALRILAGLLRVRAIRFI
jgi:hypothetical protein